MFSVCEPFSQGVQPKASSSYSDSDGTSLFLLRIDANVIVDFDVQKLFWYTRHTHTKEKQLNLRKIGILWFEQFLNSFILTRKLAKQNGTHIMLNSFSSDKCLDHKSSHHTEHPTMFSSISHGNSFHFIRVYTMPCHDKNRKRRESALLEKKNVHERQHTHTHTHNHREVDEKM